LKPSVKLVFSVDAIFPPLTGIGRYAYELATRLPRFEQVEELRLLDMFRWRQTVPGLQDQASGQPVPWSSRWQGQVRQALASRHWAVEVYDRVSERRRRQMLRQANGFVYHSPNYFLAAHDGPSVATVHDPSPPPFPANPPRWWRVIFPETNRLHVPLTPTFPAPAITWRLTRKGRRPATSCGNGIERETR